MATGHVCTGTRLPTVEDSSDAEIRCTATMAKESGRELIDAFERMYRGLDVHPWDQPERESCGKALAKRLGREHDRGRGA